MKIKVINGPNLNLLGLREPELYGHTDYDGLCRQIEAYAAQRGVQVCFYQSNHEGDLVDAVQEARFDCDGIILNPGAYTHTSVALLDALKAVRIPTVEVHLTDLSKREAFRQISYIRPACIGSVIGHGTAGYNEAVDLLLKHINP